MYLNKFSSGTILALLALSGMLLLVPIAAPVHATNTSPLVYTVTSGNPVLGDTPGITIDFTITNPASNQYAIQVVNFAAPTGWTITGCSSSSSYLTSCTFSSNSVQFTSLQNGEFPFQLPPGASAGFSITANSPAGVYPFTNSFTSTIQDASASGFYAGPSFGLQVIDPSSAIVLTVTPGGSNTATSYTAGSAPYTISAQVTCTTSTDCPNGYEDGVNLVWSNTYATGIAYSFTPASGVTSGSGQTSTTFQPSNLVSSGSVTVKATAGTSSVASPATAAISTIAGAPTKITFWSGAPTTPFPSVYYLTAQGTTTNTNSGGNHFTGAILPATAATYISASDAFGNPDTFGTGTGTVVGGTITIQTASGAVFDVTNLPSSITIANPGSGTSVEIPDDYYQAAAFGSAGVLTATISGATYNGGTLSVSGSSGTIQTSTFATSATITETDHATALPASSSTLCAATPTIKTCVAAGKSFAFDVVLGTAQANVPVTVAICPNTTCGTTKGYSGTLTTTVLTTNSSGIATTSLTVDTTAGTIAYPNATITAPTNANNKATVTVNSPNGITTVAGPAAKFTVVVGLGSDLTPGINASIPGQTVYVNVITSDAYGNGVTNAGAQQIQINLVANPNTITVTSAYIPQGCWETNGTLTGTNGCSGSFNGFGPIAWTLPSTVGSTATISASGVLGGVLVTSATASISIVSKTPTISVFSPEPLNNVIYSNSVNLQFRGWANVSAGYNGAATMSSLGWQVGTGSWQSTGLSGANAQWSVVATLPLGLSTVTFNATDSESNTVTSSTYTVLVDTSTPTITLVTPVNANLTSGQLFQATIVASEGDLNASSVSVSYNGTALPASDLTLSGTNNPGSSVTYTLTAVLPTGTSTVAVSATTLAGNSASKSESVNVIVAFANSITFTTSSAIWGTVGAYKGLSVPVTNSWTTAQTIVVFATFKSGSTIYVAQGTTTLNPGQTATVFAIGLQSIPAGTYTVTFAAVTTSNSAVSGPTTPITVVVS